MSTIIYFIQAVKKIKTIINSMFSAYHGLKFDNKAATTAMLVAFSTIS